jgi:adenylate cyclase
LDQSRGSERLIGPTLRNAPSSQDRHAILPCRAALACSESTERLYASGAWNGLPLVTRFGIHTDDVLVGNFGAPERFNFTLSATA